MANHQAADKSIRQTKKRKLINTQRKSRIKTYIKKVLSSKDKDNAQSALSLAQSEIMRGVTKKVMKLNTASRIISRLSHKVKNQF